MPGHWKGDLIFGANHSNDEVTLIERSTRFPLLLHLGNDYSVKAVEGAMKKAIAALLDELVRSVTWDGQSA